MNKATKLIVAIIKTFEGYKLTWRERRRYNKFIVAGGDKILNQPVDVGLLKHMKRIDLNERKAYFWKAHAAIKLSGKPWTKDSTCKEMLDSVPDLELRQEAAKQTVADGIFTEEQARKLYNLEEESNSNQNHPII